jgi:hypothetical protein
MAYLEEHNNPKNLPSIKHQRDILFAIENEVGLATVPMLGAKLKEAYKNNPKAKVFLYVSGIVTTLFYLLVVYLSRSTFC